MEPYRLPTPIPLDQTLPKPSEKITKNEFIKNTILTIDLFLLMEGKFLHIDGCGKVGHKSWV